MNPQIITPAEGEALLDVLSTLAEGNPVLGALKVAGKLPAVLKRIERAIAEAHADELPVVSTADQVEHAVD